MLLYPCFPTPYAFVPEGTILLTVVMILDAARKLIAVARMSFLRKLVNAAENTVSGREAFFHATDEHIL